MESERCSSPIGDPDSVTIDGTHRHPWTSRETDSRRMDEESEAGDP